MDKKNENEFGFKPVKTSKAISKRRSFLKKSAISIFGLSVGMKVVHARNFPVDMIPAGLLDIQQAINIPGKSSEMILLNDRPINAETPPHLLEARLTPNDLFFVRNNGNPPSNPDPITWKVEITGESAIQPKSFTLQELKDKFKTYTYELTLECGGNGRSEFNPPAKGNQWMLGAVGCAAWTGVRLKDVLEEVGIKKDAVYIGYYGEDTHLSGDLSKDPISRGFPIEKAMEEESMIAWAMNGKDLPLMNGYPLRLVIGGYPASCSGKWLSKIVIRNKIHDGQKMGGQSYRVPCKSVAPGSEVADEDMCIIENMPVKSLLTHPKSGATITIDQRLPIKGQAWTSALSINKVEYSIDFGKNWAPCSLSKPSNRFAWQQFNASIKFPELGYYEVWARATDTNDDTQPIILPGWNPRGYLNNACHRIAIKVVKT